MELINSTNSACVHKQELIVLIKVSVEEVEQTERECPESPPFIIVNIDTRQGLKKKKSRNITTQPVPPARQAGSAGGGSDPCFTPVQNPEDTTRYHTAQSQPARLAAICRKANTPLLPCYQTRKQLFSSGSETPAIPSH